MSCCSRTIHHETTGTGLLVVKCRYHQCCRQIRRKSVREEEGNCSPPFSPDAPPKYAPEKPKRAVAFWVLARPLLPRPLLPRRLNPLRRPVPQAVVVKRQWHPYPEEIYFLVLRHCLPFLLLRLGNV